MDQWQKISIAVLSGLVAVLLAFGVGFSFGDDEGRTPISLLGGADEPASRDLISGALEEIRSSAVNPPSERELARAAIRGMVRALKKSDDPYASFYTPNGYRAFQEYTSGHFSGIGVWLKKVEGRLEIVSVLPSTPAVKAGLSRGDVIERVDGVPVRTMTVDEAVTRIKGQAGTKVSLEVDRGGKTRELTLTRRNIDLPNLVARFGDRDLGYIRLFGFSRGAGAQVRNHVEELSDQGAQGIVLDLRDNGGGLFSEAIDVASVFIDHGEIVTYRQRSVPDRIYEAQGRAYGDIPLVVLVNEGTASASEIVAGALQDRDRAILVGSQTYGKGSVQEVFPLPDASALKLTTGAYLTPSGRDINGEGIEPDVEVNAAPAEQKRRAVAILKGIVVSIAGAQG
jgi:carboxyl-terminal processing protease